MPGDQIIATFDRPPIIELAIALQFNPIDKLRNIHFGLLWERHFRSQFPKVEEHPAAEWITERFEKSGPELGGVRFMQGVPPSKLWFLNDDETRLVQIQRDRIAYNWRKRGGSDEYPHYAPLRDKFFEVLGQFQQFLDSESLGAVQPDLCMLTYVDHVEVEPDGQVHTPRHTGDLSRLLSAWPTNFSDPNLGQPETVTCGLTFLIPDRATSQPVGRLRMNVAPAFSVPNGKPIFRMTTSVNGYPSPRDIGGIQSFLDEGRKIAVENFRYLTAVAIRQHVWGERS